MLKIECFAVFTTVSLHVDGEAWSTMKELGALLDRSTVVKPWGRRGQEAGQKARGTGWALKGEGVTGQEASRKKSELRNAGALPPLWGSYDPVGERESALSW